MKRIQQRKNLIYYQACVAWADHPVILRFQFFNPHVHAPSYKPLPPMSFRKTKLNLSRYAS